MTRQGSPRAARVAPRLVAVALVAMMAIAACVFLRPAFVADGPVQLIIVSGKSMEPGMHTGDLAVLYRRDSYHRGDVVAYRSGRAPGESRDGTGAFVIHRIRAGNGADGFMVRGDNNPADDPWQPTREDVAGEMLFHVPNIGWAVQWLGQPVHLGALLASLVITMMLASDPDRRRQRRGEAAPRHR